MLKICQLATAAPSNLASLFTLPGRNGATMQPQKRVAA